MTRVTMVTGVRHNKQPGDLEAGEGPHVTVCPNYSLKPSLWPVRASIFADLKLNPDTAFTFSYALETLPISKHQNGLVQGQREGVHSHSFTLWRLYRHGWVIPIANAVSVDDFTLRAWCTDDRVGCFNITALGRCRSAGGLTTLTCVIVWTTRQPGGWWDVKWGVDGLLLCQLVKAW